VALEIRVTGVFLIVAAFALAGVAQSQAVGATPTENRHPTKVGVGRCGPIAIEVPKGFQREPLTLGLWIPRILVWHGTRMAGNNLPSIPRLHPHIGDEQVIIDLAISGRGIADQAGFHDAYVLDAMN